MKDWPRPIWETRLRIFVGCKDRSDLDKGDRIESVNISFWAKEGALQMHWHWQWNGSASLNQGV